MEVDGSQVWFTDLWNYSLVPYLLDAVRDGLQMYGKRAPWEDPAQFILRTYPWSKNTAFHGGIESLMRYERIFGKVSKAVHPTFRVLKSEILEKKVQRGVSYL